MKITPPQPSLFKTSGIGVAVITMGDGEKRSHQYTYGLDNVVRELSCNVTRVCHISEITTIREPVSLIGLTSPMDTYRLLCNVNRLPTNTRLIIGGQGAYSFLSFSDVVHRICFGRAEGLCDEIVVGDSDLDFCYDNGMQQNKYMVRQAQYLLPGESSVGCRGRCKFCQYSATRRFMGDGDYNPTSNGTNITEDRWKDILPKSGRQTTALDGWSERTRKRVGKPVSDDEIVETLNKIISTIDGTMTLKVFQIIGYPWESPNTIKDDLSSFREILSRVKPGKGRIFMMILNTPFSPEPLTRMCNEPAQIDYNWRDILLSKENRSLIDVPHLNAYMLPQIGGNLTLYKRVAINRLIDRDKLIRIWGAKDIDTAISIGGTAFLGEGMDIYGPMFYMNDRNDQGE